MSATRYLFVYGTLRRCGRHPMARRLAAKARFVGGARYQGRLYHIAHYPGAVPSRRARDCVIGDLYWLGDRRRLLADLDRYEGAEYRRLCVRVMRRGGRPVEAWIYLYTGNLHGLKCIPRGDYFRP